jgi:hypothetical protein
MHGMNIKPIYNFAQEKEIQVYSAITPYRGIIPEKTWIFCNTGV